MNRFGKFLLLAFVAMAPFVVAFEDWDEQAEVRRNLKRRSVSNNIKRRTGGPSSQKSLSSALKNVQKRANSAKKSVKKAVKKNTSSGGLRKKGGRRTPKRKASSAGKAKFLDLFKETVAETESRCNRDRQKKKDAKKGRKAKKGIKKRQKKDRKKEVEPKDGLKIDDDKCASEHFCATVRGDPHLVTFDGKKFDCQGHGEFVLAKSLETAFEIQGRFTRTKRTDKSVSITTAISIDPGVSGVPQIDLFTEKVGDTCVINYYVNGILVDGFGEDGMAYDGLKFEEDRQVGKELMDYLRFETAGLNYAVMAKNGNFGCVLNSQICLHPKMVNENTIVGLLGTPNNDDTDDWVSAYGTKIPYGESTRWSSAYDYCTREHCVHKADDSIFGYEGETNWGDFYGCADSYDSSAEVAVEEASQECVDCCAKIIDEDGQDACLLECVEGEAEGDDNAQSCIADLRTEEALNEASKVCGTDGEPKSAPEKEKEPEPSESEEEEEEEEEPESEEEEEEPESEEEEEEPEPESEEEEEEEPEPEPSCGTPPALPSPLSFGEYSGNPQCNSGGSDAPFGFSYGWKMNGCQDGTFPLSAVPSGGGEIKGDGGSVAKNVMISVTCNADKTATLAWTGVGDSLLVVKMKGGPGGVLYDTTKQTGGTFAPLPRKGISHIEICLEPSNCPEGEEPEPEPETRSVDPEPEPKPEPEEPEPSEEDETPPAPDTPSPEDIRTREAFTKGDPHFKTFGGELYDYHGECDLVLLHNPDFNQGMGMDIHIRTKIEAFWSSVESAAIKLGSEIMEIKADPASKEWLWFNGQEVTSALEEGKWNARQLAGFKVRFKETNTNVREANIYLTGSQANEVLVMKTFKSFVRIDVNWEGSIHYTNSVGLLGDHAHEGKRLGRDGQFIKSVNKFGQEWQVQPEVDGSLFHSYEGAVVGKKCVMPPTYHKGDNISAAVHRRLGASALDDEKAEKACNHLVDPEEHKACVYDVIATQDLSMASAW